MKTPRKITHELSHADFRFLKKWAKKGIEWDKGYYSGTIYSEILNKDEKRLKNII